MDEETWTTATTARHAFVATVVALIVIVVAFALWQLKVVLALILLGFTIAAAMRPGIDRLASWRIPRPVGLLLHYVAVLAVVGLFLSFVVPTLTDQVQTALHAAQTHHPGSGRGIKAQRARRALAPVA